MKDMTGYEKIVNASIKEIALMTGVPEAEAAEIKIMTRAELERLECICPETLNGVEYCAKCRKEVYSCAKCRKEFLDGEI